MRTSGARARCSASGSTAKCPKARIDGGKYEELVMLIQSLDELYQGRTLEVGDVLTSRLRALVFGLERGEWDVANELLTYTWDDHQFVPDRVAREPVRAAKKRKQADADLASVGRRGAAR